MKHDQAEEKHKNILRAHHAAQVIPKQRNRYKKQEEKREKTSFDSKLTSIVTTVRTYSSNCLGLLTFFTLPSFSLVFLYGLLCQVYHR